METIKDYEWPVIIFLGLLSLPALIDWLGVILLVIYSFDDSWVTVWTIESAITDYLYMCALIESLQYGGVEVTFELR